MNAKCSKKIAKVILFFFWCAVSTYTMPSAIAAKHSLECGCNPSACVCSHESPCHEKDHSKKDSVPMIISASCQSGRNAVEANVNFDIYPPTDFSPLLTVNKSSDVFLKEILAPSITFLDPPFKPPKSS